MTQSSFKLQDRGGGINAFGGIPVTRLDGAEYTKQLGEEAGRDILALRYKDLVALAEPAKCKDGPAAMEGCSCDGNAVEPGKTFGIGTGGSPADNKAPLVPPSGLRPFGRQVAPKARYSFECFFLLSIHTRRDWNLSAPSF